MAFYIDIFWGTDLKTGSRRAIQVEHTYQKCVESGWFDPETATWIRETIEKPESEEIDFPDFPRKDPYQGHQFLFMKKG